MPVEGYQLVFGMLEYMQPICGCCGGFYVACSNSVGSARAPPALCTGQYEVRACGRSLAALPVFSLG
jgi:hypothetical protein